MPRRSVLTEAQHAELFALPESEPDLVRYWTLSSADLRVITSRRRPHNLLTGSLTSMQCGLLDSLLLQHNAGRISILAWIRQPPGRPGRRAFAEILERLSTLRAIGLEPEVVAPVHPERLRRLNQEGVRLTAQHQLDRGRVFELAKVRDGGKGAVAVVEPIHEEMFSGRVRVQRRDRER